MERLNGLLERLEVPHDGGTVPDRWNSNDIKPIEKGRRKWGFWTYHNYWVLVNSNISTYMGGSSLIALGLNWWQAIIAIVIGNLLSTAFVILNSLPGAYYHIGFPIANRYVWGMYGSQFVILNRILLSLVWYGFQAWIGGSCLYVCLSAIWPSLESRVPNHMPASMGITSAQFLAYAIFMIISLPVIYIRPHKLTNFFYCSSATILVFEIVLLIWSLATMGPEGFGDTISATPAEKTDSIGWLVCFGIISTIGGIAAGILNQNDYARFSRRPRDAILGQVFSFPIYAIVCSIIGILVTAATQERYGGEAIWSLPDLLLKVIETGGSRSRAAAFFGGAALVISQMGVNIPGNALSGGFDLAATFPRYINIRRGAYLTALLSIAVNPWKLATTASTFLSVLSAYSVFLGPMIGCMIAAYLVVHRQKLKIPDLYKGGKASGIYWYSAGINWRAPVAWAAGTAPSLPGFLASIEGSGVSVGKEWTRLYYVCFLSGFGIAAVVYVVLHAAFPARAVAGFVKYAPPARELMRKYRERCDAEAEGIVVADDSERVSEDGGASSEEGSKKGGRKSLGFPAEGMALGPKAWDGDVGDRV